MKHWFLETSEQAYSAIETMLVPLDDPCTRQPLVEDLTWRPAPDTPDGPFVSEQVLNWTEGKPLSFATGLSASIADGRLLPPQPLVVAKNQQALRFVNERTFFLSHWS